MSYPQRTSSRQPQEGIYKDLTESSSPTPNDGTPTQDGSHNTLIDLVTNEWRHNQLLNSHELDDYSDDEKEYFIPDKEPSIVPPIIAAWCARLPSVRIPRKVQRYLLLYLFFLVCCWFGWLYWLRPAWLYEKRLDQSLESAARRGSHFGSNVRPLFSNMIHMKQLDPDLIPGQSKHGNRRLVFVGDVHGCLDELQLLLATLSFNKETDHLVLTGDVINKGPDSKGVVDFLQSLNASSVRGNHEDRVLLAHASLDQRQHEPLQVVESNDRANPPDSDDEPGSEVEEEEEKTPQGDKKTRKLAMSFTKKQIAYLEAAPVILKVGPVAGITGDLVVVHAGLAPGIDLERQDPFQVMNMRSIDLDTRVPSELRIGEPWEKVYNHFQEHLHPEHKRTTVIYGHDAKTGLNLRKYSQGLDSGCVRGGKLTALLIDHKGRQRLFSVNCIKEGGWDVKEKKKQKQKEKDSQDKRDGGVKSNKKEKKRRNSFSI